MISKNNKDVVYTKIKILRRFRYNFNQLKNAAPETDEMTVSIPGEILELPLEFAIEMIYAHKATQDLNLELGIDYIEKNRILTLLPTDSVLRVQTNFKSKLEAAMHIYNDFNRSGKVLDEDQTFEYGKEIVTVNNKRIKSHELKKEITNALNNKAIKLIDNKLIKESTLFSENQIIETKYSQKNRDGVKKNKSSNAGRELLVTLDGLLKFAELLERKREKMIDMSLNAISAKIGDEYGKLSGRTYINYIRQHSSFKRTSEIEKLTKLDMKKIWNK